MLNERLLDVLGDIQTTGLNFSQKDCDKKQERMIEARERNMALQE